MLPIYYTEFKIVQFVSSLSSGTWKMNDCICQFDAMNLLHQDRNDKFEKFAVSGFNHNLISTTSNL